VTQILDVVKSRDEKLIINWQCVSNGYFTSDDYNRLSHVLTSSESGKVLILSVTIMNLSVGTKCSISSTSQYSSLTLQGQSTIDKIVFQFFVDDYQHLNHDKTNGEYYSIYDISTINIF